MFCFPSPKNDAQNALNLLIDHWIVKFGITDILVTRNENDYINGKFTHFGRTYNVQFKPRTPYAPWLNEPVENSNRKFKTSLCTVLDTQYFTLSQKVKTFHFALNSPVGPNMNLSPYEIIFDLKPEKLL